ncbi:TetR/AcrR family transcriptional regulator [Hydrogenibacillus sp. N12]|uniref:TetR/AcrR family transcriptional regulator n=1 Tax=Hydrogenibacillus sp. N12 TaxID=2866627 RepID=UPI00207C0643|nr:TetR/AcrR family transcriptional regulator [Hydrogenibacillus sp. N12]
MSNVDESRQVREPRHAPPASLGDYVSRAYQAKTARGQATRQKLLDAAEEIFGHKGYFETSVVDIVRHAGVSQGTFYVYFPSKLDIFRELVMQLSRSLRREIAQRTSGVRDRREFERRGFEAFFDFVHKHRNLYRIVRQAEWIDEGLFRAYYEAILEGYMRGLRSAQVAGEIRDDLDLETLALCLMAVGDYLGMRWVLWEGQSPPERAVETMLTLVFEGMSRRSRDLVTPPRRNPDGRTY